MTDRKTQILQVATKAFSQEGYDGVTVRQLAEQCGISEPAVYRHYPSKEALYDAVLDSIEARMDRDTLFNELKDEFNLKTLLDKIAEHVVEFFSANDDIQRLLMYSALSHHVKARQVYDLTRGRYVHFLKSRLEALLEAGKLRPVNPEITARCFIGMIFDCALCNTLWKRPFGKHFEPAETIANNVPIYAFGLEPRDDK